MYYSLKGPKYNKILKLILHRASKYINTSAKYDALEIYSKALPMLRITKAKIICHYFFIFFFFKRRRASVSAGGGG